MANLHVTSPTIAICVEWSVSEASIPIISIPKLHVISPTIVTCVEWSSVSRASMTSVVKLRIEMAVNFWWSYQITSPSSIIISILCICIIVYCSVAMREQREVFESIGSSYIVLFLRSLLGYSRGQ